MPEPIDDVYLNWLYSKVSTGNVQTPSSSYWKLLRDLHSIEFVWLVIGDDNRAEDGLDLRKAFINQSHIEVDPGWMHLGCSVLEMLVAFSRVAEFETDRPAQEWFWEFIDNLGLTKFNDARTGSSQRVTEIIDRFVWRTYRPDGKGGLFPLRHPEHDQRKVEIWYQFCEYLVDHDLLEL